MAARQPTLQFHLDQVANLLTSINGEEVIEDQILTKMTAFVLRHSSGPAVAQQALPNVDIQSTPRRRRDGDRDQPNTEEQSDDHSATDEDGKEDDHNKFRNNAALLQPLADSLLSYAQTGQCNITVADLYLEADRGSMANIKYLVIKAHGFARRFSVSGCYVRQFNRYVRAKESNADRSGDLYVRRHAPTKMYFTSVISFVPECRLHQKWRYDIDARIDQNIYIMHADIKQCRFLGKIPEVYGKPIDIAVQQGHNMYGFHLSDHIPDRVTCHTIKNEANMVTTLIKPCMERKVDISPHLVHAIDFDCVYVCRAHPRVKRAHRNRLPSGAAGDGSDCSDDSRSRNQSKRRRRCSPVYAHTHLDEYPLFPPDL